MAAPMIAGLPPDLEIGDGYILRLTALNATSGAVVSGVTVSNATIQAVNLSGAEGDLFASGPFRLVPGPGS